MVLRRSIVPLVLAAAELFLPGAARAELGGTVSALPAERGLVVARSVAVEMGPYARHDVTRANGGVVHEFVNADGHVFAVTWAGPGKPDLRTLLGRYFTIIAGPGGGSGAAAHSLRRPVAVDATDLQIETGGHMGWFHGVAFIPSLAPAGFVPADLLVAP